MQYIVTTNKTIDQVVSDLETVVTKYGFGILHVHNLKQTMNNKGVAFDNECRILEICNPHKAKYILTQDMGLNMVLPCKISVYEDQEQNKIGTLLPTALLGTLSDAAQLQEIAKEVEAISKAIIDDVK